MKPPVVLVTGGAGFLGSRVVNALIARGDAVRVLDDLSTGDAGTVHPSADLIVGDVTDPAKARSACRGASRVIHLAARRAVPRSFDDPAGTDRVNRVGTAVVLDAAQCARVERFVFASSSSVYGDARIRPTPEHAALRPLSPYGKSKVDGESLCRRASLDAVCLRYFNIYGPGQPADGPYATLIPRVLRALTRGDAPTVYGDGQQRRDFTYIDDAVRATLAALDAPGPFAGEAFNVAGGTSWSVVDVVELMIEAVGVSTPFRAADRRLGDPIHTEADLLRARTVLGYQPSVALPEGLRAVIASAASGISSASPSCA